MPRYWIGVASFDHVQKGIAGNFCQVCHGKAAPLKRMKKDDWIIYYSPRIKFAEQSPCKSFTAVGKVLDDLVYQFEMAPDFIPFRRNVGFIKTLKHQPIIPILDELEFVEDKTKYGAKLRYGHFEISEGDFKTIVQHMRS